MNQHPGANKLDAIGEMRRRFPELQHSQRSVDVGHAIIRVIELWLPRSERHTGRVVFVAGWASTIYTWRHFIPTMCMYGKVCYVETREKPSSKVSYNADFSPSAVAADIARYIDETCSSQGYGLVASSTGANVAIESWQLLELKPEWMVLLLPHAKAPIPGYVSALKLIPDSMLPRLRRLLLSMAGKSLIPKKVAAQREGIIAALGTADLRKLRASATAWRGYVLDTASVRNIDTRTLVVGASSDRMHSTAGAQALLSQLPNGHWLDAVTFPSAHGSRAAEALLAWALEPQPRQRV